MGVDTLITTIFKRPCIWDKRRKDHANRNVDAAWKDFSKEMNVEASGVLLSWGVRAARIRRVVGGESLDVGAWPWLVSLNYKGHHEYLELQGLDHLCGGTLVDLSWVLTAAHCVHFASGSEGLGVASNWDVILGEHDRRSQDDQEQRRPVAEIIISPNYTLFPKLTGDIALLRLQVPAVNGTAVQPVEVDTDRDIPPGTRCKAAGWGQHVADNYGEPQYGNGTMVPHVIEVQRVSFLECLEAYAKFWPKIDANVVCFASDDRKDTCKGDSGGPLLCVNESGQPVVSGVVSVGMGCAMENYPGIYTRVASYRDWIRNTIESYESS